MIQIYKAKSKATDEWATGYLVIESVFIGQIYLSLHYL